MHQGAKGRKCARASLLATSLCVISLLLATTSAKAQFCPDTGTVLSTSDATEGDAPFVVRCCDLDGDGDRDLVTANDASDTVSVLLNHGDGTHAPKFRWPVDTDSQVVSEPVDVVCCEVSGDGLIDLVTVNHTSDDVSVLLNTGNTQFAAPVKYTVGEAPFGIECLNLDGDADNDVITNGFTADAVSVLLNNGDGTFAAHVPYPAGDAPIAMTLCDVDGDGDDDVVTANMLGKDVTVLQNNADGTFTASGSSPICRTPTDCINPFDIVCCDFDGINGPDVATSNGIDDSVAVLFNDGSGGFGGLAVYTGVNGAYSVACCDLDGDADTDVVTANLASGTDNPPTPDDLGVFFNDGTGVLGGLTSLPVGVDKTADPSSVICCNVDTDTDPDVITTFVDGLTLFTNDCDGGTCGDGVVDAGEECDGSDDAACPGNCTSDCDCAVCGDSVVEGSEECDDGALNSDVEPDACRTDCTLPRCGDGVVDTGEDQCSCPEDAGSPPTTESNCTDGFDNDCDGCIDLADADCGAIETACSDGIDNDCDGVTDCSDPDCPACPCPRPTVVVEGSRYIGVTPEPGPPECAIYIEGVSPGVACHHGYVQDDGTLAPNPVFRAPGTGGWGVSVRIGNAVFGAVHARALELLGEQTYNVYADCDPLNPGAIRSEPAVPVTLWRYGDTNANGTVGVDDVVRVLRGFSSQYHVRTCTTDEDCDSVTPYRTCDLGVGQCLQSRLENVDLTGGQTCLPNREASLRDVLVPLAAFRNDPDACLEAVRCP